MIELWPQKHPDRIDTPPLDILIKINGVAAGAFGVLIFIIGAWHAVSAMLFNARSTGYSFLGAVVILLPGSAIGLFLVFKAIIRRNDSAAAALGVLGAMGTFGAFITIGDGLLHGKNIGLMFYLICALVAGCMLETSIVFTLWSRKIGRTRAAESKIAQQNY